VGGRPVRISIIANGRQARGELQRTGSAATGLGRTVATVAKSMGLAFAGIEVARLGGELLHEAVKFQSATNLLVTAGGESRKAIGLVSDGILKLAGQTGTSSDHLAEGMYTVEKAGFRAANGLLVLKNAAEGARAEQVDMATMTSAVTSVMTSYHEKAQDSAKVVNELVAASGAAKTSMQLFAGSLASVLPTASAAGISFAEVGGAIATLTQHGTSADEATQELANTIRNLQAPNNVASQEMQQLGINVSNLSKNLGKRGLTGTLDLVVKAIGTHMGKAGLVMLDAFKKSQSAGADLQIMIQQMPKDLAGLSRGFLDGSVSMDSYRKGVKGMGADGAAMGTQFLGLVKSSKGFNNILKSGNPAAQTFTDALKKMLGGATGMNTALQLTGENMSGFRARVEEVDRAAKSGGKSVSTWAATQKTAAVQIDRLKFSLQAIGIKGATALLPVLTKGLVPISDWLNHNEPAFERFGHTMVADFKPIGAVVIDRGEGLRRAAGPDEVERHPGRAAGSRDASPDRIDAQGDDGGDRPGRRAADVDRGRGDRGDALHGLRAGRAQDRLGREDRCGSCGPARALQRREPDEHHPRRHGADRRRRRTRLLDGRPVGSGDRRPGRRSPHSAECVQEHGRRGSGRCPQGCRGQVVADRQAVDPRAHRRAARHREGVQRRDRRRCAEGLPGRGRQDQALGAAAPRRRCVDGHPHPGDPRSARRPEAPDAGAGQGRREPPLPEGRARPGDPGARGQQGEARRPEHPDRTGAGATNGPSLAAQKAEQDRLNQLVAQGTRDVASAKNAYKDYASVVGEGNRELRGFGNTLQQQNALERDRRRSLGLTKAAYDGMPKSVRTKVETDGAPQSRTAVLTSSRPRS
jgi:TP901 family phage tail tape measure protein